MHGILLIRHAETALNASRVIQFPDTPLSDRGRWQAARLAARLGALDVTHVVSSDYRRARDTAQRICEVTGAALTLEELLRERNLGELRGRPYTEVRDQVFDEECDPGTGESWRAFHERVDRLWEEIQGFGRTVDGTVALVTHGLVCRALVRRHLTLTEVQEPLRFPNTSVTIIDPERPWSVRALACDAHLHETSENLEEDDPDALVRHDRERPPRRPRIPETTPPRPPGAHGASRRRGPSSVRWTPAD